MRNPIRADWMDILQNPNQYILPQVSQQETYIDIHPDCRPKLKFVKHIKHPIARPNKTALRVNSG